MTHPQIVGICVILFALPDHIFCLLLLTRQIRFLFRGIELTTQLFFDPSFNVTIISLLLDTFSKNLRQELLFFNITFMLFELQGKFWAFFINFNISFAHTVLKRLTTTSTFDIPKSLELKTTKRSGLLMNLKPK